MWPLTNQLATRHDFVACMLPSGFDAEVQAERWWMRFWRERRHALVFVRLTSDTEAAAGFYSRLGFSTVDEIRN